MIIPKKCKECLETINHKSQYDLDFQRKELQSKIMKIIKNTERNSKYKRYERLKSSLNKLFEEETK